MIPDHYAEFQTEEQRLRVANTRLREECHRLNEQLSEAIALLKACVAVADSGESDIRGLPWEDIEALVNYE